MLLLLQKKNNLTYNSDQQKTVFFSGQNVGLHNMWDYMRMRMRRSPKNHQNRFTIIGGDIK